MHIIISSENDSYIFKCYFFLISPCSFISVGNPSKMLNRSDVSGICKIIFGYHVLIHMYIYILIMMFSSKADFSFHLESL